MRTPRSDATNSSDINSCRQELQDELCLQSEKCTKCKLCRKECKFLQKYGSPKYIADTYDPTSPHYLNHHS
ncbi:MAG: hypothetical protein L0956_04545, partial [Candidatus Mariimomonas ferrooxydans]